MGHKYGKYMRRKYGNIGNTNMQNIWDTNMENIWDKNMHASIWERKSQFHLSGHSSHLLLTHWLLVLFLQLFQLRTEKLIRTDPTMTKPFGQIYSAFDQTCLTFYQIFSAFGQIFSVFGQVHLTFDKKISEFDLICVFHQILLQSNQDYLDSKYDLWTISCQFVLQSYPVERNLVDKSTFASFASLA